MKKAKPTHHPEYAASAAYLAHVARHYTPRTNGARRPASIPSPFVPPAFNGTAVGNTAQGRRAQFVLWCVSYYWSTAAFVGFYTRFRFVGF